MQTTIFPVNEWQRICDDYYTSAPVKKTFSFFTAPLTNSVPSIELSLLEFFYVVSGKALVMNNQPLKALSHRTFNHWQRYQILKAQYKRCDCNLDVLAQFKRYGMDYVTIAGIFKPNRRYDTLTTRSAYIMLNFNELIDIERTFRQLQNDVFLKPVMLYRSINGGIVAIMDMGICELSYHSVARNLCSYIAREYHQLSINQRISQYTCPTFVTYDPNAWLSPEILSEAGANIAYPERNSLLLAA